MKKIIILILAIVATVTVNAQQRKQRFEDGIYSQPKNAAEKTEQTMKNYDLCINGTEISLLKCSDLFKGMYDAEMIGGHRNLESVKEGVRSKMERIYIPECDYEAFKTNNGMYILMNKTNRDYYDSAYGNTAFRLFENKEHFEWAVSDKVKDYNRKQESRKRYMEEMERKHKIANDLGF